MTSWTRRAPRPCSGFYSRGEFEGNHEKHYRDLVQRAHVNLGHPGRDSFLRLLRLSNVPIEVIRCAKDFRCAAC